MQQSVLLNFWEGEVDETEDLATVDWSDIVAKFKADENKGTSGIRRIFSFDVHCENYNVIYARN